MWTLTTMKGKVHLIDTDPLLMAQANLNPGEGNNLHPGVCMAIPRTHTGTVQLSVNDSQCFLISQAILQCSQKRESGAGADGLTTSRSHHITYPKLEACVDVIRCPWWIQYAARDTYWATQRTQTGHQSAKPIADPIYLHWAAVIPAVCQLEASAGRPSRCKDEFHTSSCSQVQYP